MHPVNQKSSSGDSLLHKAGGEDGHLPADLGACCQATGGLGLRGGAALDRATQTSRGPTPEPRRCQGGFLPQEVPESRESGPTRLSASYKVPRVSRAVQGHPSESLSAPAELGDYVHFVGRGPLVLARYFGF